MIKKKTFQMSGRFYVGRRRANRSPAMLLHIVRGVKYRRALLNRTPAGTGEGIKNNRSEKSERLEKRSTIIFREFAA